MRQSRRAARLARVTPLPHGSASTGPLVDGLRREGQTLPALNSTNGCMRNAARGPYTELVEHREADRVA
jgi:hypothetical protein